MEALLAHVLSLPELEQRMLAAFCVVHEPLNRMAMADWLKALGVRNDGGNVIGTGELSAPLERWLASGVLLCVSDARAAQPSYRVSDVRHGVLARLQSQGELEPLMERVREQAPWRERYGALRPMRMARELLWMAHRGGRAEVLEVLPNLAHYGCQETPGTLLLDALGLAVPGATLASLSPELAQAYLRCAIGSATAQLLPLGPGVLAFVAETRDELASDVLAQLSAYHAFRGERAQAHGAIDARDDGAAAAARMIIALTGHELALARELGQRAIEHTRAKKSRNIKGLFSPLTPWVLLTLLTDTETAARSLELARVQLQLTLKKNPGWNKALHMLMALHAFLAQGTQAFIDTQPGHFSTRSSWFDALVQALVLRYAGQPLPDALSEMLRVRAEQAEAGGYAWLSAELAQALDPSCARGLSALYLSEEPWRRSVRMLDAAIDQASHQLDSDECVSGERLVFTLLVTDEGDHTIVPRLQTSTRAGFSSGRQVTWKKLSELALEAPFVSDEDRRVIRHASTLPDYGPPGDASHELEPEAVVALVGHPRVFGDAECREPVEVVRGAARVEVLEREGELVLTLVPSTLISRTTHSEREGEGRIAVYMLTPAQQHIAARISPRGLCLPEAARASLARSLGKLSAHFPVASAVSFDAIGVEHVEADARPYLELRRRGTGLTVLVYGCPLGEGQRVAPGEGSELVVGMRKSAQGLVSVRAHRNLEREREHHARLLAACPTLEAAELEGKHRRIGELSACLELLCELRRMGDDIVVGWPDGRAMTIVAEREVRDMRLKLTAAETWLSAEGELEVDKDTKLFLRELLSRVSPQGGRFVELDEGRYLSLSDELKRALDTLNAHKHERGARLELHPHALWSIASLVESKGVLETDAGVAERLTRIREAALHTPGVPSTFEATLRPYQEEGYVWLSRLARWGAGAILADDMGLGKTLQTLALLLEHAPHGPSLVVAPTSVCENWLDEAKKFAPTLRMVRLDAEGRAATIDELGPHDVLICSYAIMQLEIEALAQRRFRVAVLDEAQAIKNGSTLRARAAMQLVADVRIALSGTPVENHLGELWSIMTFVNPGLLGSAKSFQERFARPIQRERCRAAAELLKRTVRPFVLRRKKSEVLDDLPEKTVITLRVVPSPEERALFAALREEALSRAIERSEPTMVRMLLLAELQRMRRAACHPDLVAPEAKLESTKLAALETLLEELRAGRHRALVFSQYVDYLTIVRRRLEALGIGYQYLDGSSSTAARAAAVRAFQAGEGDVFLISLKAGGFGLNLTAADYVIHLDPWWNPAVEDQASDRAHRIGQERPVTIYRLVMQGSIEEKMLALHADKRQLADELLEGTGHSGALSVDELLSLMRDTPGERAAVRRVESVQVEA